MMRHVDEVTTLNVYGKAMMHSKLEALTKLLGYAGVGFVGWTSQSESYFFDSNDRVGGIRREKRSIYRSSSFLISSTKATHWQVCRLSSTS